MTGILEVRIDGVLVTPAQIAEWEIRRARSVLAKLRRILKIETDVSAHASDLQWLCEEVLRLKEQCGRERLREALRGGTRLAGIMTKVASLFSGSRRKQCVTEVKVQRWSAEQISQGIDDLMINDTSANRQCNLLACPDHFVLEPRGMVLEVIETTGGSPFPARFFMQFGDESGVVTPRDPAYSRQSVGTARLSDGTVAGGVRHQFRDEGDGALVRLMVEFPFATPNYMIRQHQWHLACEFSSWLNALNTSPSPKA